jgi:ectoine hydroxylase-related dioxygenase (phytanoyl-CoA dioxygenase family)
VNVAWTLHSVTAEDGGFVVIPGSHKASMDMPDNDPADPAGHKGVAHPLMEPGDVCMTSVETPPAHRHLSHAALLLRSQCDLPHCLLFASGTSLLI